MALCSGISTHWVAVNAFYNHHQDNIASTIDASPVFS
jgi:hypothetical protein